MFWWIFQKLHSYKYHIEDFFLIFYTRGQKCLKLQLSVSKLLIYWYILIVNI